MEIQTTSKWPRHAMERSNQSLAKSFSIFRSPGYRGIQVNKSFIKTSKQIKVHPRSKNKGKRKKTIFKNIVFLKDRGFLSIGIGIGIA